MTLPDWLDLAGAEKTAFRQVWGMVGANQSWGELIASAQAAVAWCDEDLAAQPDAAMQGPQSLPLVAAARLLDNAARVAEDESQAADLALLAAMSFAMYGNTPSAFAVARSHRLLEVASLYSCVALSVACPRLVAEVLPRVAEDAAASRVVASEAAYLQTGAEADADRVRVGLIELLSLSREPFETLLLGQALAAWQVVRELSLANVLRKAEVALPDAYLRTLIDQGRQVLLPPQRTAILTGGLLTSGSNALVVLPTSSGKTMLGELALVAALGSSPGISVYIAPYVALGSQVIAGLRRTVPSAVRLHGLLGGYVTSERLDPENERELIVATPERFDSLLKNNPAVLSHLRCVVVDEAHMLGGGERGVRRARNREDQTSRARRIPPLSPSGTFIAECNRPRKTGRSSIPRVAIAQSDDPDGTRAPRADRVASLGRARHF